MSVEITELDPDSIQQAHAVIQDAFKDEDTSDALGFLEFSLDKDKRKIFNSLKFFILRIDGEAVGVMGLVSLRYDPKDTAWLCYPAVKRSYQNQGLGTRLLDAVLKSAKERQIKKVYTDTSSSLDSIPAISFYSKNGFKEVGGTGDYHRKGEHTRYMMREL